MATKHWPLRQLVEATSHLELVEDLLVDAERSVAAAMRIVGRTSLECLSQIEEVDELTADELTQRFDALKTELKNVDMYAIAGARLGAELLVSKLLNSEEFYVTFAPGTPASSDG